ncbi:MAG: hypothetical protein QM692_19005 [Thermomicrobiales bacterium]
MEPDRFDQMTGALAESLHRRKLAAGLGGGLAAALGLVALESAEAAKNKRKKKRKRARRKWKKQRCRSAYGKKIHCRPQPCCDPATSTVAACTDIGFPTCCASSGKAHPPGATCCSSYFHGIDGICTTDYPVCCTGELGAGCCLPGTVCCDPAVTGGRFCCSEAFPYCCPQQCCATNAGCDANGFCLPARQSASSASGASSGPAPVARPEPTARPADSAEFTNGDA